MEIISGVKSNPTIEEILGFLDKRIAMSPVPVAMSKARPELLAVLISTVFRLHIQCWPMLIIVFSKSYLLEIAENMLDTYLLLSVPLSCTKPTSH